MQYLDVRQFESYVAACVKGSDVRVVWDDPSSTPRTNGKVIYIPRITSTTSNEWMTRVRYFVKHEVSHIVYSDFELLNKHRPKGLLAIINNIIEDHRIDYLNDTEYTGDAVVSNEYWELYADQVSKNLLSADKELSEQQLLTLPLFIWDAYARDWIYNASSTFTPVETRLDADGTTRLGKLAKYTGRLLDIRNDGDASDVYHLACDILKDLYDADHKDYEETNAPDDEKAAGKAGKDKSSESGDEVAGADDKDRIINVDKLTKAIGHEHKPTRTGLHFTGETDTKSGTYEMPKSSDYVVVNFPELHPEVADNTDSYFKPIKVKRYITNNSAPLANKLRLKLQTRSRDRYEYGKKRGKLHTGSLHRLFTDDHTDPRVFRKRVVSDTLDTCVTLLVDCSGSMAGDKFEVACAGAGAVSKALTPLNIKHNILGFTNTHSKEQPIIWNFKKFDERVATEELVDRFGIAAASLMQNSDGDAIAYAHYMLSTRKETRKVLLVLSDGSPAGREWAGNISRYTHKTVQDAERAGIDVYGIGILDRNVEKFYTKHTVVNDLDELTPRILSVLDRSI